MPYAVLEQKLKTLPENILTQVYNYAEFLVSQQGKTVPQKPVLTKKRNAFGILKDHKFYMSPDFDKPLEDFAEYM